MLLMYGIGNVAAMIVSSPHESYVREGDKGTVRCQNRSDDGQTIYSHIANALWYRDYGNGSHKEISRSRSDPVYANRHFLYFAPPVREVDEGTYYCCVPNGPCGNSSERNTVVRILSEDTT